MYSYRILKGLTRKIAKIPAPILPVIATARARGRVRLWRDNSFISPLEPLHEQTVAALDSELRRRGQHHLDVLHAYEFRRPDMSDALRTLRARGCDAAVVVPMYIAEGDFTHGMTRFAIDDALRRCAWPDPRTLSLCSLGPDEPSIDRLAASLAEHCLAAMRERNLPAPARDWAILLAAHGTVVNPPAGVDNGLRQAARVLIEVKRLLKPHAGLVRIGWLNHTRGGRWTTPAVVDILPAIQRRGFQNLVYFPWGFTTDNAETALEGRVALAGLAHPFQRVEYLQCLNTSPSFIKLIADRVCEHISALRATDRGSARSALPASNVA
jgi:ferrochelatase